MAFSLPNIVIKPYLATLFHRDRPLVLPCPKTQEHQITCVDSWVHRVPENGHQPLGRGNSLWRSACPILWSNPILQRYFTEITPLVLPCPKTQEHQSTCVDSWVHRVPENGHQPLGRGNSLWWSACPILWSNPYFNVPYRDRPLCTPLPQDSGTPKYLCRLMSPWGTRKWTSVIGTRQFTMAFSLPNIVIKPDLLTLFHGDCPLYAPLP